MRGLYAAQTILRARSHLCRPTLVLLYKSRFDAVNRHRGNWYRALAQLMRTKNMKSDVPPSSEQDYRVSSAIIEVAEETTISALKLITIQRGHDPRDFILLVSGGAGPKLASKLAREMSVRACVIPVQHGIFSAWGMLAARPRVDLRQMVLAKIDEALASRLSGIFDQLELEAAAYFGVARRRELVLTHTVEGRYRNQEHSVAFECPPGAPSSEIMKRMHAAHKKAFTFDLPTPKLKLQPSIYRQKLLWKRCRCHG